MFLTSHQVVVDPVNLDPILIVYANRYRQARSHLRLFDADHKIHKASKATYYGLPAWKLYVKFSDPNKAQAFISAFPKKTWMDNSNQPIYR